MPKSDKKDLEQITITLSQETLKNLEDGDYNKSKLIDGLLTKHFSKIKKDKKNNK